MSVKNIQLPILASGQKRSEWEDECWNVLVCEHQIEALMTKKERHDIVIRALITTMLLDKKSYRDISKQLFVSQQTISLVRKSLRELKYQSYRERGERRSRVSTVIIKPKKRYLTRRTKYGTIKISV